MLKLESKIFCIQINFCGFVFLHLDFDIKSMQTLIFYAYLLLKTVIRNEYGCVLGYFNLINDFKMASNFALKDPGILYFKIV